MKFAFYATLAFMLSMALLDRVAAGAEIELRAECQAAGPIATLGDVAHIMADEATARTLAAIELVPAPAGGRTRTLHLREVQDLLTLQGVRLVDHTFHGASSVVIRSGGPAATAPARTASHSARRQLQSRVERAIVKHLEQSANDRVTWQVNCELDDAAQEALAVRTAELVAEGGEQPWVGQQQFVVQVRSPQGVTRIPVTAEVTLPDMIAVARRPLRRGEIVQASDVELQMPPAGTDTAGLITRLEDLVGQETTRSVATGQPLEISWVRKPVLVRRGEIVTVFARGNQLQVRTQARAAGDGGLGDIVTVERLDNRQRFTARVVGVQELEVFVSSVRVVNTR